MNALSDVWREDREAAPGTAYYAQEAHLLGQSELAGPRGLAGLMN